MIIGIGTDLIDVARIEEAIKREHFTQRVFTKTERERINSKGANTAAGYFAAKEAVAKALGTGFDGFFMEHISITNDEHGKPECTLLGGALERFNLLGGARIHISISHADGYAIAFCILESLD